MTKIIQFIHDGQQFTFPRTGRGYEITNRPFGIRFWNTEPSHKRKFIRQEGYYVANLNSLPQKDKLNFWGEWEAQSFFKLISGGHEMPNSIHKPIFIKNSIPPREGICHSTDPYVFNKYHLYTHCKQGYKSLQHLDHGSIILFGSSIGRNFVLDEVFVVDNTLTYDTDYNRFVTANNDKLIFRNQEIFYHTNYIYTNRNSHIYYGKNYFDDNEFFSFFPCKISQNNNFIFERPVLPDNIFNTIGGLTQGLQYENFGVRNYNNNKQYWNMLVRFLIGEGYSLGLYAKEPNYFDSMSDAKNKLNRYRKIHKIN